VVSSVASNVLSLRCPQCGGAFNDATFCPQDGARLEAREPNDDPYVGLVLSGDIEILSPAGAGAMGRVFRARQRSIDRDVAVKILHRELSGNAQLVRRFHREAKIASKLRHPHVVDMHMVGELPDGSLYIVMEYLDGRSLADTLAQDGPLSLGRAIGIALQVSGAVGEGHALGIVHRDLKPENVMLVNRGTIDDWVKILDFGIARIEIGDQSMETAAGGVLGTARYISPEGASGAPVGPPGDVYAIATMLYQMLAGRTPFDAVAPLGLLVKHVHEAPPPLRTFAPDVPEEIERAIMANLAKAPEHRAPTGRAFGALLASITGSHGTPEPVRSSSPTSDIASAARQRVSELGPTLYDSSHPPGILQPVQGPPPTMRTLPLHDPTPLPAPGPSTVRSLPEPIAEPAPAKPPRRFLAVGMAFALGIALATAVAIPVIRGDRERSAYLSRARRVFADGHYTEPPGENVKDLVAAGLVRWPEDGSLEQLRSAAEQELVTMAMAAHGSGDVIGARELAHDAYDLDPTDNSARYARAQADDAYAFAMANAVAHTGPPRLLFESPPMAHVGDPVEMRCAISTGAAGPIAKITDVRVTVFPNGRTDGAIPVEVSSADPTHVHAVLKVGAPGSYDVTFEAAVDGTIVRAMRDLDVVQPEAAIK
jgi:serine/threonine-protein kinase